MECSDFMQQLRSFKPQSLGCAVARRKSSTTLIFPLPPQACSGKYSLLPSSRGLSYFLPLSVPLLLLLLLLHRDTRAASRFRETSASRERSRRRYLREYICMRRSYRWFRPSWITHDYHVRNYLGDVGFRERRTWRSYGGIAINEIVITPGHARVRSKRQS